MSSGRSGKLEASRPGVTYGDVETAEEKEEVVVIKLGNTAEHHENDITIDLVIRDRRCSKGSKS